MKKNILIVTTSYPPSTSIGTQRILKICKFLNNEWNIHILTLKEKYYSSKLKKNDMLVDNKNDNLYVWRTKKFDIFSHIIGIKEKIIPIETDRKPSIAIPNKKVAGLKSISIGKTIIKKLGYITDLLEFPDKEISWLPFAVFKGCYLINRFDIDIIFTSSPRHSNLLIALFLKILTKKRLVVDFRDPWARSSWLEEKRTSSAFERLKHTIIKILEKQVVGTADQVVFVTQSLKEDFHYHYNYLPPNKFKVFYNGYDPDRLIELKKSIDAFQSEKRRIIFSHIGSLYKKRNPEKLVLAIKKLIETKKIDRQTVLFKFIGNISPDLKYIIDMTLQLKIEDVVEFIPAVSYSESHSYMQKSDILIILQPGAKLMLPAKFFDYICFSKPIFAIGEKGGEVEKIVSNKFGIFVENEKPNNIQDGILKLLQNPRIYEPNINKNRKFYDISKSIENFEKYLEIALMQKSKMI